MKKTGLIVVACILLTASVVWAGSNEFGVNCQAHMMKVENCGSAEGQITCVDVIVKWNDAYLSNADCEGNVSPEPKSYIGSGAWITNHQRINVIDVNGIEKKGEYFVKVVAVPNGAELGYGIWYTEDGSEIGPAANGFPEGFAIILETSSFSGSGQQGILYLSPYHAGLGAF